MLPVGQTLQVMLPGPDGQLALHGTTVRECEGRSCVAGFDEDAAAPLQLPAPGTEVAVFYHVRGKFFQQTAMVAAIRPAEPRPVLGLTAVGEPVSAEKRGAFRACVITSGMKVKVEKERDCAVVDIGPGGFAAVCKRPYEIGKFVAVALEAAGAISLEGAARVQTTRPLGGGKTRYGFMVLPSRLEMRRALEKLTAAAQREQLKRMARSA